MKKFIEKSKNKAINIFYSSSKIYKKYNLALSAIGFLGKFFILIVMLSFSYRFKGVINFIYILYCLVSVYRYPLYFKQRRVQLFSKGIYRIKRFIYLDILTSIIYQIPIEAIHEGEDKANGWQSTIGFYTFCSFRNSSKDIEYKNLDIVI